MKVFASIFFGAAVILTAYSNIGAWQSAIVLWKYGSRFPVAGVALRCSCAPQIYFRRATMEDTRRRDQINRVISKYQLLPPEDRERVLTLLAFLAEDQHSPPCAASSHR